MNCIICNKLGDKLECDECGKATQAKSVKLCGEEHHNCSECKNQLNIKNFYVYKKNGKPFNKCKSCFNKKVKCEICNKEINRTYKKRHDQTCAARSLARSPAKNVVGMKSVGEGFNTNFQLIAKLRDKPKTDKQGMKSEEDSMKSKESEGIREGIRKEPLVRDRNRTLIVGPCFCGKTYLIMKLLQELTLQEYDDVVNVIIITQSPEQYTDVAGTDVAGTGVEYTIEDPNEMKSLEEYRNKVVVFDDVLDHKQKDLEPFFTRGRHKDIDVYYLSQSYFDLPPRTIRNNSNIIILFQQTKNGVEHIYNDIAGLDMSSNEWKEICRKAWSGNAVEDKYNYLQTDKTKDRMEGRYTIRNANSNKIILIFPQTKPF